MVRVVRSKAAAAVSASASASASASGGGRVVPVVASVQELDAPPSHFSVVVIGNAFHRLPRDLVASRVHGWLQPGGFLALCWSSGTQAGPLDWQAAFGGLLRRWQSELSGAGRVPGNWDQARRERPDADVLTAAGFARTLSVLPTAALADHAAAFDDSLSAELGRYATDGYLTEAVSFACELAVKGPSVAA